MSEVELSVIMPSFLGAFEFAATDRERKLARAVESYVASQGDHRSELVLVSDGCAGTAQFWRQLCERKGADPFWHVLEVAPNRSVQFIEIEKQERFSGKPRNAGLLAARGSFVAYLDSDDMVQPGHFQFVVETLRQGHDWVLFDDLLWPDERRHASVQCSKCGTSNVAHRLDLPAEWPTGYGHDYEFILQLQMLSPNWTHAGVGGYIVCHVPHTQLDA